MKKIMFTIPMVALALAGCSVPATSSSGSSSSDPASSESASSLPSTGSSDSSSEESDSTSSPSSSSTSEGPSSSSSDSSSDNGSSSSSSDPELDDYTIMVYLCGSNLESDCAPGGDYASDLGLATMNIQEMLSVSYPDGVNVIIQTGGCKKWETNYGISATKTGRYHISNHKLVSDAQLAKANMGLSSTFQSFLEWGLTEYPAKQTGVILWNHGGGMDGCCYDENYNGDSLLNSEANTALKKAFASTGREDNLAWIGYDCCLMGVQDIADFNSGYFDYMVSSQETEPGEGWDYTSWLGALSENPEMLPLEVCTEIADTYVKKCETVYNSYSDSKGFNDATMSVIDLSKMEDYGLAFEAMADELDDVITSNSVWSSFKTLLNKCQRFGASEQNGHTYYDYDVFDLQDFCDGMQSSSKFSGVDSVDLLEERLNDIIAYDVYGKDSSDACGLSLFCPISGYSYEYDYTASETNYSTWRTLVNDYGSYY